MCEGGQLFLLYVYMSISGCYLYCNPHREMKQCVVYILFINIFASYGKELPSYINKCKRNDPGLDECMTKHLLDFRTRLSTDIKELKLPSLEPYVLPQASVRTSWMNATFTNFQLYGANKYDVVYFKIDLDEGVIWLNLSTPYFYIKADYELDGKLLQLTLHGEGRIEYKQNDTTIEMKLYGNRSVKNNTEYLNLEKIDFKLAKYTVTYMYLHDLFRNNPELTERINSVIADNLKELTEEIIPLAEEVISAVFLSMFKQVFGAFSLSELFD